MLIKSNKQRTNDNTYQLIKIFSLESFLIVSFPAIVYDTEHWTIYISQWFIFCLHSSALVSFEAHKILIEIFIDFLLRHFCRSIDTLRKISLQSKESPQWLAIACRPFSSHRRRISHHNSIIEISSFKNFTTPNGTLGWRWRWDDEIFFQVFIHHIIMDERSFFHLQPQPATLQKKTAHKFGWLIQQIYNFYYGGIHGNGKLNLSTLENDSIKSSTNGITYSSSWEFHDILFTFFVLSNQIQLDNGIAAISVFHLINLFA